MFINATWYCQVSDCSIFAEKKNISKNQIFSDFYEKSLTTTGHYAINDKFSSNNKL
jgi:hypothetical protein